MLNRSVLIFSLIFLFIFSLTGCFLLPEDEEVLSSPVQLKEPVAAKINTQKVKRGNIVNKIQFWAIFSSPAQYDLSFAYMGRLKDINVSAGDRVKAGDILAELESDNLDLQLAAQRINFKKAQLYYDKLKTEFEINGGGKYQLDDAKLNIEYVQLSIDSLEETLSKISIVAPISGIVSYVDDKKIGDNIDLRTTFISVCDTKDIVLIAKKDMVTEALAEGTSVKVKYNGKDYTGKIAKVPDDNRNENSVDFRNAYAIKVDGLDTNSVSLNDTASVELILQEAHNVLIINKSNIKGAENDSVYILKDGVIEEQKIVTGIKANNGVAVEVKEGLNEDDEVGKRQSD